jgi:hypothetical protein
MTKLNNAVELIVDKSNQYIIEQFVEEVSDKLMINDTYFGNLISGLNDFYSLLIDIQPDTSIRVAYITDYQSISFLFYGVSRETASLFENTTENSLDKIDDSVFIISNLTESIEVSQDGVVLTFDIGAMNRKIYDYRKTILSEYLKGQRISKSIESHDKF